MSVTLIPFSAADLPALLDSILQVYARAFAAPPYNQGQGDVVSFEATIQRHIERGEFCGYWACGERNQLTGFAYGYAGGAGQWWYDIVAPALGPALAGEWLSDYFEFVELAVDPVYQGQGIGGRLHDTLLACTRRPTAALTTAEAVTPALLLYRKRGWITLLHDFIFPGDNLPRQIMAKKLIAPSPEPR
jgi:hypothetical protein